MKTLICLSLIFFCLVATAQKTGVGQACPDPQLPHVLNYKSGVMRLSQFRPRLVILDFWNTHCLACIKAFPHLDSLQQKFRDQVQIILVNSESREATLAFFAKRKKIAMPGLPMITGDTQLIKIFTREGYPYSVWIDGKGIVRYITAGYNTTEAHIRSMLTDQSPGLSRASKIRYVSLLTEEAWREETVFFSGLSLRREHREVGNSILPDHEGRSVHLCRTAPAFDLFKTAFAEGNPRRFDWQGSVELEVKDSATFRRPGDANLLDEWDAKNWYNYELVIPTTRRIELYAVMQEELCRYFGKSVRWEKRKRMGIALVRIPTVELRAADSACLGNSATANNTAGLTDGANASSSVYATDNLRVSGSAPEADNPRCDSMQKPIDLLRSSGATPSGKLMPYYGEVPEETSMRVLINQPFSELSGTIRTNTERMAHLPYTDETGYQGRIDISLPWKIVQGFDLDAWRRSLRKYGLDLVEKPLDVDVLVIQDRREK